MAFDFLDYGFMQRALLAGIAIGTVAPLLGMFVMVRRQSLIADTLAHASLAGVAIGILVGTEPLLTAAVVAIGIAVLLEALRSTGKFAPDALLALVLSGSLAFSVVAMSAAGKFNSSVLSYLFGGITTVSPQDLTAIVAVALGVVFVTLLAYRQFFLISLDEDVAAAQGMNVRFLNIVFTVITAATVAVGMRVVGVLLIGALMIIPVLAAARFAGGFKATSLLAVFYSLLSVVAGMVLSFYFDIAAGGTIVLFALGIFILSSLSASLAKLS